MLSELAPHPVLLAPMVGLSHFVVRRALQEYLPEGIRTLWPTEMLSSRRIPSQKENASIETFFYDKEYGLCPQLLGNEEATIEGSVKNLVRWGARAIDINMGCPVSKALKHNYGVALMGDPAYAAQVTRFAVKHASVPVSVKLRSGLDDSQVQTLHAFVSGIQDAGASWITLHPRTAEQKRKGRADWTELARLRGVLKIPVVGNGDIQCLDDIRRMRETTGVSHVMVGRAAVAKPWLLSLQSPGDVTAQAFEYGRFLKRVATLSREYYPERDGLRRFRFMIYHGSVWLEFGHTLFTQVTQAKSYAELQEKLEGFFENPGRMIERTELRH